MAPRLASCQETELGAPRGSQILRLSAKATHVFQAIGETAREGQLDVLSARGKRPAHLGQGRSGGCRQADSLFPGDGQAAG